MQYSWSYIKDCGTSSKKLKILAKFQMSSDSILVCLMRLALRKRLSGNSPKVSTENIIRMADFVLKNNFFWIQRLDQTTKIRSSYWHKFAPPYACIFMDKVEFLKSQELQPFLWLRLNDDIFLYGLTEKKSSLSFLMNLIIFIPIWNLHMKPPAVPLIF